MRVAGSPGGTKEQKAEHSARVLPSGKSEVRSPVTHAIIVPFSAGKR